MAACLEHRGPDGHATWVSPDGRAAFGHARLAIIDTEKGAEAQKVANALFGTDPQGKDLLRKRLAG